MFAVGQRVKVKAGPFSKCTGTIESDNLSSKYGPIQMFAVNLYGVTSDFYPEELRPLTRWERIVDRFKGT